MIVDILLFIIGSFVSLVASAFGLVSFVIPDQVEEAVAYFIGFLDYASGIANIPVLLEAIGTLFGFFAFWYGIKLVLFIFALIPWFGKQVDLPKSDVDIIDLRKRSNTLNLRKTRGKNIIRRT